MSVFLTLLPPWPSTAFYLHCFHEEWDGTVAEPIRRAITSEEVARLLPATSLELFNDGAHKVARPKDASGPPRPATASSSRRGPGSFSATPAFCTPRPSWSTAS